jgi:hypothetical protein
VIRYAVFRILLAQYIGFYERDVENSSSPALPIELDPGLEYGATFRFPITWSYLIDPPQKTQKPAKVSSGSAVPPINTSNTPKATKPVPPRVPEVVVDPAQPAQALAVVVPTVIPSVVPTDRSAKLGAEPRKPSQPETKWEMVIPKMVRPLAPRVSRPQRALSPAPKIAEAAPVEAPTEISFYADSETSFVPRRWKMIGLSAAVVVVGCAIAWVRPGSQPNAASEPANTSSGTWSRRTAYVTGSSAPREILVYSGSDNLKNYRIEFSWVPEPRGVGWIFRATDSANYYAARLRLVQAGAIPTLSAEHFAVVKGVEGPHSRKVITLSRALSGVSVRMDATGPAFTLYLQGNPADYWTDERFEAGSLGFYEERGERPVLQGLRFTLFKKSGLQTVTTSLQ